MKNLRIPLVAGMFLSVVAAGLIPTASAQTGPETPVLTLALDSQGTQELKPLQNSIELAGKVTFTSQGNARTSLTGVTVQYTVVNKPAWASVIISPATDVITFEGTPSSPTATNSKNFKVIITASADAPAFQANDLEIQAQNVQNAAYTQATAKQKASITASYFSILDVQVAEPIKQDRPQNTVTFPIKVTNFGNANTKVSFEIVNPPSTGNIQVLAPGPVQLQAKQAGGNLITAEVPVTVQTPYKNGYLNQPDSFQVKVTGCYALDCKLKGDETTVSLLVTTRGFYVPGPSPLLLVGLAALAAVILRRK